MLKRFVLSSVLLLTLQTAYAAVPPIDQFRSEPNEVPAKKPTDVIFSARIASDAQHVPAKVRLLRLQWSGNSRDVSPMWDTGSHGDTQAKDGIYACTLKLKEPIIGVLSFTVEVKYKGMRTPIRSQPLFVNVVGAN